MDEEKKCSQCLAYMKKLGVQEFRTGGTAGGWKLLFGELAELGEEMIELELWACPQCRHVELYLPRD